MPKMKAHASFDLYLADQPAQNRKIIAALRAFMRRAAPGLEEFVKWGNGCWIRGKTPVAYVYSDKDHVHYGFIRGSSFADPKGLLNGNGQYVRHVKVRSVDDIDEPAFRAFLRQALAAPEGLPGTKPKATAAKARAKGARPKKKATRAGS